MTTSRAARSSLLPLLLSSLFLAGPALAGLWFKPAPAPDGADASALAGDGATLWAGTLRGVWKLQSGAWSFDGLSDRTISSIAVAGGSVWAATGDALYRRAADGTWSGEPLPGSPSFVNTLFSDGTALWAGGDGVFARAGASWMQLSFPGGIVSTLFAYQGDLVAGVVGQGAVRYPGGTGVPVPMSAGLGPSEGVQAFAFSGGVLYAGTGLGVYAWSGGTWVPEAGFGIHDVRALASASGSLWAASVDAGVSQKSGSSWSAANGGLLFTSAKSFALLGTDLYVGTAGAPVYRFSGGTWTPAGTGLNASMVSEVLMARGEAQPMPYHVSATRGAGFGDSAGSRSDLVLPGCGDIRDATLTQALPAGPVFFSVTNCGPVTSAPPSAPVQTTAGLPLGTVLTSVEALTTTDVLGGTSNAGVWRLSGGSWSEDNTGLSPTASVGVLRRIGDQVFAGAGLGVERRGSDGTWTDDSTGLSFGATVLSFGGTATPGEPVFAGLTSAGIYRRDPGPIWRKDSVGVSLASVFSLEARNPRVFAAAGTAGFLRKQRGAWLKESAGLPAGADVRVVRAQEEASFTPGAIYAGTAGQGLFAASPYPLRRTLPVILDVTGSGGARFRSELTIGSAGTASLTLTFQPSPVLGPGGAAQSVTTTIGPGEVRAPDALDYLRSLGMQIPQGENAGSLTIEPTRPVMLESTNDSLYATARSYTAAAAGGTYGVFLDATSDLDAAEEEAYVYGLRSVSGVARSNLAVTYAPAPDRGSDPITLEVQVWDAAGRAAPTLLTRTLAPGEWFQWNGVLEKAGLPDGTFGYARVRRVSGIGPFIAYGVVNDAVTSDGSVLPMVRPGGLAAARKIVVPVVLDVYGEAGSHFTTELTLANDGILPTPVDLVYRPAPGFGSAQGAPVVTLALAARQQTTIPDVIQYLRDHGVGIPDPLTSGAQAGTLSITFRSLQNIDSPRTVALARTSTPGPSGGSYGVFYPAFAAGGGARTSALVPALVRSAAARSNLAVVHAGGGSLLPVTLSVQLYDATTGAVAGNALTVTLNPGDWFQWSRLFDKAGVSPGTTQAYAVVTRVSGDDTFLAYGVVNDAVTSDGSFIAMIPAEEY